MLRAMVLVLLPLVCAACANDPGPMRLGAPAHAAQAPSIYVRGGSVAGSGVPEAALPSKTVSDKILTAIALERVTGRKPDPGRLNELN